MPPVHRLNDVCSGHGCYSSRPIIKASETVFADGMGIVGATSPKIGQYAVHCCGPSCHDGFVAQGSSTVFVEGLPVARIGDPVSCGGTCKTGSPDVNVGG